MIIYHYHPETKELLNQGIADPSPLEPGKFLIPAHATDITPPEPEVGLAIVFENEKWVTKVDHRGKLFWSKTTKESKIILTPGEEPTEDMTELEPQPDQKWDNDGWVQDDNIVLEKIRRQRDLLLIQLDPIVTRHRDQLDLNGVTTLSSSQYNELLMYRQALRDLPNREDLDLLEPQWPTPPSFI